MISTIFASRILAARKEIRQMERELIDEVARTSGPSGGNSTA
jgi:hypothetical protein